MAEVIAFPQAKPDCRDCVHALVGPYTYCALYQEEIVTEESTALDCEWFERG